MLSAAGKRELLHAEAAGFLTLVETGLYLGSGSGDGACPRYVVIDLQEENCALARQRYPGAFVFQGDSGTILPIVLKRIDEPACFWLDAHLVVDFDQTEALDAHPCPLLAELEAIRAWKHGPASSVLIDDVRLFGEYGWPRRGDVLAFLDLWQVEERDDILICRPKGAAAMARKRETPEQPDSGNGGDGGTGDGDDTGQEEKENPELYAEMVAQGKR